MSLEPHELTEDEVREIFLKQVWVMIRYWQTLDKELIPASQKDCDYKVEGIVHSVLTILDGAGMVMPGFIVAPCPHIDDKHYLQKEGENWYPENHESNLFVEGDIGGCLAELMYKFRPEKQS